MTDDRHQDAEGPKGDEEYFVRFDGNEHEVRFGLWLPSRLVIRYFKPIVWFFIILNSIGWFLKWVASQ